METAATVETTEPQNNRFKLRIKNINLQKRRTAVLLFCFAIKTTKLNRNF